MSIYIKKVLFIILTLVLIALLFIPINKTKGEGEIKGWQTNRNGTFYYDLVSGEKTKGFAIIDNFLYEFKEDNGNLIGFATSNTKWQEVDGKYYWYENGIKQGTKEDPKCEILDKKCIGREVYDPNTDAWYWLDATADGARATNKDVYRESEAGIWAENEDGTGKWVRYGNDGKMVKGWDTNENGTYYFDLTYGTMAKGKVIIDNKEYYFDENTGVLHE